MIHTQYFSNFFIFDSRKDLMPLISHTFKSDKTQYVVLLGKLVWNSKVNFVWGKRPMLRISFSYLFFTNFLEMDYPKPFNCVKAYHNPTRGYRRCIVIGTGIHT